MATRKTNKKVTKQLVKSNLITKVRDQAQDIWMAGLGVIARVQDDSGRVLEKLIADSKELQVKAAEAADVVKGKLADPRVTEVTDKITGQISKVGHLVETRATGALSRAGLATKKEVDTLSRRVSKLGAEVERLSKKPAAARKVVGKTKAPAMAEAHS